MDKIKTNAIRIAEKNKISYKIHHYECDEFKDGLEIAEKIGMPKEKVFKTLVTVGKSKNYNVFVIPVECELDMKLAAKAVGEKNVEMIAVKDINAVTGYIRGGCTPVGMKKKYKTIIDKSCENFETIIVSAGRIGDMMELPTKGLIALADAKTDDIVKGTKINEL